MASNTTYGDWMRPMPGGIRNIGIPLTIAGMGVLTCTLLVSMASVVAAIAILVVGMGVILVLAIRDREHRNMVDRAVEKRTWMAAQRTGANLYRSGLLAPIDGGKAMLPGILSRVVLTSALDGLGREFCLVRHAHTGEYSLLLSCQPQGASLADDDVEDSYVASWAGLMESLASETGVTQLAVTVDTAPDSGVRFRRTLSKRIVKDAPELAARAMAQIMDQYAAGGASNDVTLTLTFRYTDRDGKYLEAGEAARRISLLLPSIREQIAQAGGGAARALGMEEITRMVRVAYDPAAQETIEESDEPPYIAWEDCGPLMHEAGWSHYSHDSGLSRTWEMVDPPQSNVTADTLTRLLSPLADCDRKRVTVLYRMLPPDKTMFMAEQNRQKAANQVSQEKRATVRSMSQIGKANRQAVETNQGAVMVFFGMLVTVTVSRGEQESQRLEAASRAVEQAAGGAKIDLRPCYGAQDTGFAASLPWIERQIIHSSRPPRPAPVLNGGHMMPMPWKPSKRKGTMPSATATDPVARMESMLLGPLKAKPDEPVPPMPWRGKRSRGGGYAALMPTIDEFFGTSNQVCGGFWPFGTDMALPAEGVPVGRSLMTGAGVCCDPISWFKAGIIKQPSMFLLGLPAIGKSTFVRREVLGLSALGMNAIIPGDLKPDYASLVNMLGGQVIRLGAGIGVVNPLDPGDLHYALQRLEGKARKDLTDYYNDTRAALMEVLLTIMRTGREADDVGGARGVTARESDILSVAVRVLHDRHGDDPQPPVIADLRDLLREGPDEVRMAAVWDDPENDELYRAQVRGLLADLHGFSNRMTKFGRLFGDQTTARIDLSRPVDFDISALAQSGDDVVAAVLATTWTSAFAAKNAADVLAEEGLQPRRNHVIIMDEMHRALRASPLMVEKLDLLTRLNRQWGVGQIMITHTFKDLMCMETPAQNTKARGFVERSEIKVLGALSRIEVDRYLRGECGLPVSRREEDMLEDWATPVNFGSDASHKGLGRFLIKLGGLPGIPINVEMCPLEKSGFNDTNLKWHA